MWHELSGTIFFAKGGFFLICEKCDDTISHKIIPNLDLEFVDRVLGQKNYAAAQLSLAQELDSLHFGLSFEFLGVAQFVLLLKTLNFSDDLAH